MRPLLLLIALLLALPVAACAEEEGTFTPAPDSMGLKPVPDNSSWTYGDDAQFLVALTPRLENRSLRIHWLATLNHYVAKVQVRVNGKLLGTQMWPREARTRGGAFDLPVNLPLWEPCHVQLTAQVWNQDTGTRQLESVTVGTEDLRAARIVAGNPQLVMDSRKGTAVLSLSPNRPWVQVEVGSVSPLYLGDPAYTLQYDASRPHQRLPSRGVQHKLEVSGVKPAQLVIVTVYDPFFDEKTSCLRLVWPSAAIEEQVAGGAGPLLIIVILAIAILLGKRLASAPLNDVSAAFGWASLLPFGGRALAKQNRWSLAWWFALAPVLVEAATHLYSRFIIIDGWSPTAWQSLVIWLVCWLLVGALGLTLAGRLGPVQQPVPEPGSRTDSETVAQLLGCGCAGLALGGMAQLAQRRGAAAWRFAVSLCWLSLLSITARWFAELLVDGGLVIPAFACYVVAFCMASSLGVMVMASIGEAQTVASRFWAEQLVAQQPAPEGGVQDGLNPSS